MKMFYLLSVVFISFIEKNHLVRISSFCDTGMSLELKLPANVTFQKTPKLLGLNEPGYIQVCSYYSDSKYANGIELHVSYNPSRYGSELSLNFEDYGKVEKLKVNDKSVTNFEKYPLKINKSGEITDVIAYAAEKVLLEGEREHRIVIEMYFPIASYEKTVATFPPDKIVESIRFCKN